MRKIYESIKKLSLLIGIAAFATPFFIQPAKADAIDEPYLRNIQTYTLAIQEYTNSILATVNQIPAYLAQLPLFVSSWLATDNGTDQPVDWTTNWSNQQNWLASLSTSALNNEANQYTMQQNLLTTFFGANNLQASPPNPGNVNDLSYLSLLGQPLVSPDPRPDVDPAMNYLINASGLAAPLVKPSPSWRGSAEMQKNYANYYNTMTSVQTYNAFVLSRLFQDSKTLQTDNPLRKQLITQSSDSNWFSSIITNDLGWVLRQILLYNSQLYVLMDQLLQAQKQMTATLAMTNTLIIVNNEMQGNMLLKQAQGT